MGVKTSDLNDKVIKHENSTQTVEPAKTAQKNKDYLATAKENVFQTAKTKVYFKLIGACLVLLLAGILSWSTSGSFLVGLVPLVLIAAPALMLVYNHFGFKHDQIKGAIAQIVDDKVDVAGGIVSGLTTRKKYLFDFETDEEEEGSFWISRGGWFSTMSTGKYYLILYRNSRLPGPDNFLACEELQGRLFGVEVAADSKPKQQKGRNSFVENVKETYFEAKESEITNRP